MAASASSHLAVPSVCLLIAALSYGSQLLFFKIEPGPLLGFDFWSFNVLVAGIWICYARAILTNAGTAVVSKDHESRELESSTGRQRYCRKCGAVKPARAHHCKICERYADWYVSCIPKMDHHCPWTANCVSHFTIPHFIRFLIYAVAAMTYLERLLYVRAKIVWQSKDLRYDLGPSVTQLVFLFLLIILNSLTLFLVGITAVRSLYALVTNTTTIESWEIERHEQLLRRARVLGGYLDGPDGIAVRITRQEFPFDIGFYHNVSAGMGSNNPLAWLWPFAATPKTDGTIFDTNGFEEPGSSWPPPDPDRMPRRERDQIAMHAFTYRHQDLTDSEEIMAFKRRQEADLLRRSSQQNLQRRKVFHQRFKDDQYIEEEDFQADADDPDLSGEEGWQDSGGNRLKDYGVDEDVEFYDEDEIPLSELIKKRRAQ